MIKTALLERFSEDELTAAVLRKQDQFAGLLTEEAALRVVAHENGVVMPPLDVVFSPLSSARAGQLLCAKVRVLNVFSPKRFDNGQRSGRLCKLRIADASGSADLVLWNSDVDLAFGIPRNAVVNLKDVVVKVLQPLELHSRLSSEITVVAESELAPSVLAGLPVASMPDRMLSELREGEQADVWGRVLEKQPLKEFKRADKTGHLSKIKLSDGAAFVWAACWDENAHVAQNLNIGDTVKIEGGVLKNGELSVSWSGRLLKNLENPALATVEPSPIKSLAALDGAEALIEAKIDKVFDAQRVHKCKSCGAKAYEKMAVCACGSQDFTDLAYVSLELSDSSGQFRAVLFDSAAESFLGVKPATDLNLLTSLKRDYLAGKHVKLLAYAKKSGVSGQKEIVGKAVIGFMDASA